MLKSFETSRFYLERSDFRWLIRNRNKIIANAVVHNKTFLSDKKKISIAGVAEICVDPSHRRKGLVKELLSEIHDWAKGKSYSFAFLFGDKKMYQSSGYIQCNNQFKYLNHHKDVVEVKQIDSALYYPLKDMPWPEFLVDIQGPMF
jgi:predicted acetyltransferase